MVNEVGAKDGGGGEEVVVTVEEYLEMSEEQRNQLPKARQKKLARQAEILRKKAAKSVNTQVQKQSAQGGSEKKKAVKKKGVEISEKDLVDETLKGEKKIMKAMLPAYHPKFVESSWGEWWEAKGFNTADVEKAKRAAEEDKFVMVIPPPNVTGSLHLGHALMATIEDVLTRWHRMHGRVSLYLPGVDHAGIATQVIVEKQIAKDRGLTRQDLGREAFVAEVWKWKEEYGGKITRQLRRIGVSADWSREEFTLSEKLSRAVKEAFVRLYDKNYIYRDTRLVNWCCKLRTAISEIEVEYIDITGMTMLKVPDHDEPVEFGVLTRFAYKVDGSDEELVVATTRLETMLGDVAVAVHPGDPRYQHLIGKELVHPFVDRKLVVVGDSELVDIEFGTGAVKVTPAHDPKDFKCGRKHNLAEISVIDGNGDMNENAGKFAGMKRYVARVEVHKELEALGLFRGRTDHPMRLGLCSRSGDVIEPMLKPQWYVNCSEMARRAADAVKNDELQIVPKDFVPTWFDWLDNIRDWCVSRQLWWGHRIPAYWAEAGNGAKAWVVGRSEEEALERASNELGASPEAITLKQDKDVLDTWFSSGLFPFSVFGWPEDTDDLQAFFPTTLLETGHDILFFWVARMVMLSLTLTDQLPFKTIFLHAMVRDKMGRKMSKSRGNVIDPLEVINGTTLEQLLAKLSDTNLDATEIRTAKENQKKDFPNGIPECGADALRYGLLAYTTQVRDINLDVQRVVGYRNFCNKLWNATKFALANLGEDFVFDVEEFDKAVTRADPMDLFILHVLNDATRTTEQAFKDFAFSAAVTATYNFWLYDLCDIYLEAIKPVMNGDDEEAKRASRHVLYQCLHVGLRLLHPMMPFVTEELFQRLPNREQYDPCESICISPFPQASVFWEFTDAKRMIDSAMDITRSIRSLKAMYDIKPSLRPEAFVLCRSDRAFMDATAAASKINVLAQVEKVGVIRHGQGSVPGGCGVNVVNEFVEVHLMLSGLVDFEAEITKLQSSAEQKRLLIEGYQKKMEGADYNRTPQHVQEKNTEMLEKYQQELATLEELSERFRQLLASGKKND